MAIKIELFEDTGPVVSGRGTPHQTWELDLGTIATTDDFSSRGTLARPGTNGSYTYSYERYVYARITCDSASDYKKIKEVKWYIENTLTSTTYASLLYKHTNVYASPTNTLGSGKSLMSVGSGNVTLTANTSTSAPNNASSAVSTTDGTTFYTDYLVIQVRGEYPSSTPTTWPEIPINLLVIETVKD